MSPTTGSPVSAALADLDDQLDALVQVCGADLAGLSDVDVLEFARSFERLRNRLSLVDHRIVSVLESNGVAKSQSVRSTHRLLTQTLRIPSGEARRRVLAAKALLPQLSMCGETVEITAPVVAAAQAAGEVSPTQVQVILGCLDRVDRLDRLRRAGDAVTADRTTEVEVTLTGQARVFDPAELQRCADKIVECLHPDGVLADDREQQVLRELSLNRHRDGLYSLRGVLTGRVGAALNAVLTPLATRRETCTPEGAVVGADDRDYPARLHDALDDAVQRLLKSDTLPTTGGVPATVLITVAEADLASGRGFGCTSDGAAVPVALLSDWADEADTVRVGLDDGGRVLTWGREKRIANKNQTLALIARDEACTFPGCDHPPQWCDRHHVVEWADGGRTDVDNLTLLCRYHHRRFHDHGWSCRMIDGLPHWVPPRWVDLEQAPLLNDRLRRRYRRAPRELANPDSSTTHQAG